MNMNNLIDLGVTRSSGHPLPLYHKNGTTSMEESISKRIYIKWEA
jgi:hypothetical protein